MSPLGTAPVSGPAVAPVGTAAPGPVATQPLAVTPDVGVPPMLAAPEPAAPAQPAAPIPAGAIGSVVRTPSWSTPGGMRRESVESVRTPGASAAVDRAEALFGAAGELDLAAQRELAATADAQAAAQETAAAQQRELQAQLEARERQRQARVDQEASRYLEAAHAAGAERPSLASARDAVGYPSLALLTIAQGILGANAGTQGREPPDLVGAAIDRQLADQRARYEQGKERAEVARTAYGQLRAMGADAREADLAYASSVRQQAIETMQRQMARITDPAQRAQAAARIAMQQAKQAAAMAELRGKIGDKLTEREKYQAGSSGGGQYMVQVRQADGSVAMMPLAQAKQYQELMGQTADDRQKNRELDIKRGELDLKRAEAGLPGSGGAGLDPKTVIDPQGRAIRFPSEKDAAEYRARFDGTQTLRRQLDKLEEVDAAFKSGKLTPYEAQQRADALMSNIRIAVKRGVRGETDVVNEGERAALAAEFPAPQYTSGLSGAAKYAGDVWAGVDRNKVNILNLRKLTEDAAADAAKLANERGKLYEEGRGGRGDPARNLDLKPRR